MRSRAKRFQGATKSMNSELPATPGNTGKGQQTGTSSQPPNMLSKRSCATRRLRASIRLCQIIHNLADVRLLDWRTVNLDHLGHLDPPEVFLEFRTPGLGLDIVGRMARRAVVLHHLQIGTRLECRRLVRKLVGGRLGVRFGRT